jgi:putative FmdB family regulatory protein
MPLYEYFCEDCDRTKLEQRGMGNRLSPLPVCPTCKKEMAFQLSGPVYANVKNPAAG